MKRFTYAVLVAALAALATLPSWAWAQVQIKTTAGTCLDTSTLPVLQATCDPTKKSQNFSADKLSQGANCLATPAAPTSGSLLTMLPCTDAKASWLLTGGTIKNVASGLCVDTPAGTKAQVWSCDSSPEQQLTTPATPVIAAVPILLPPLTCLPAKPTDIRIGVTITSLGTAAGAWAYWWCADSTRVTYNWRAAPASTFTSSLIAQLRSYSSGTSPDFVNTPTTLPANDPSLVAMLAEISKAAAADTGKPGLVTWKVAVNGTTTTRPSFAVVAGKRSFSSTTRVAVGAPCDCSAMSLIEGTTQYCQVAPALVAVCTKP